MADFRPVADTFMVREVTMKKGRVLITWNRLKWIKEKLAPLVLVEEQLSFKAGQIIFYRGHHPYGLYVVRRGRVVLHADDAGGRRFTKRVVGSGMIFGEEALKAGDAFEATATAVTDSDISFFPKTAFKGHRWRLSASMAKGKFT